MKEIKTNPLVS